MIIYYFANLEHKKVYCRTREDLNLSEIDRVPREIEIDNLKASRIYDKTSLYQKVGSDTYTEVRDIDFILETGKYPSTTITIKGEVYQYIKTIDGVINVADFTDTLRRMHNEKNYIKSKTSPLDAGDFGYGIT